MTLAGAAQVAAAHCPNKRTLDPAVCSQTVPTMPQPAALWPSPRNVLRRWLSSEYYQILITKWWPTTLNDYLVRPRVVPGAAEFCSATDVGRHPVDEDWLHQCSTTRNNHTPTEEEWIFHCKTEHHYIGSAPRNRSVIAATAEKLLITKHYTRS